MCVCNVNIACAVPGCLSSVHNYIQLHVGVSRRTGNVIMTNKHSRLNDTEKKTKTKSVHKHTDNEHRHE